PDGAARVAPGFQHKVVLKPSNVSGLPPKLWYFKRASGSDCTRPSTTAEKWACASVKSAGALVSRYDRPDLHPLVSPSPIFLTAVSNSQSVRFLISSGRAKESA